MLQRSPAEMEAFVGRELKKLRLHRNTTQQALASQAGVSLGALKSLESGKGCTLKTLVSILKALGRESWIETIAPIPAINPLVMTSDAKPRQRAVSSVLSAKPHLPSIDSNTPSANPLAGKASPAIPSPVMPNAALSGKQRSGMSLQELAAYNASALPLRSGNK